MTKWCQNVSNNEKKTFWACFSSWGLDTFVNQMFGLLLPTLISTFAISQLKLCWMSACTLLTTALGGWVAGALSDRYGRVKTLQLMIIWFAVMTFMMAFANNYYVILILRALQGFAIGGEWAAGAVLMAETIRSQYRGRMMPLMQSGWAIGLALALIVFFVGSSLLPQNNGWRIMFAIGLLPALLIFFVRRHVVEPEREIALSVDQPAKFSKALFGIFSPPMLRITILSSLLGIGAHGGYHTITTWLPIYLRQERQFSMLHTNTYMTVIIIAFCCGCLVSSYLVDKIGRRFNVVCFAIGAAVTIRCYLFLPLDNVHMLLLGFPLGFFGAGIPATLGILFNELYPQQYRGAGVGFSYNFGRLLAAFLPFLVNRMSAKMSLGTAIGIDASWAYSLVVISVLLLPETREGFKTDTLNGSEL